MKNILYLHAGAEMYGADKILLEVVVGIDKSKFNPIVILPSYGILFDKLRSNGVEVHVIDYPILRRKYFNINGIVKYIFLYNKKSFAIFNFLKNRKIDIIHVNTLAVLEGIFLKRKLNAKLIWHVHEIIINPKIVNLILSYLVGKYSDRIVTVSKAVKNNLLKTKVVSDRKINVIYNGVENNLVDKDDVNYLFDEFNVSKESIRVGMIGRINSWKGQEDFIEAMVPILKSNKRVEAFIIGGVFAGEEWRIAKLKKLISYSGFSDRIHLDGFRDDTQYLFKFFDIFVLPSTKPDPLPTVVLEAMSAGKPIVGYKHGGITEMVVPGRNGILSLPNDKLDLSKSISKLINSNDLIHKFGKYSIEKQQNKFSKCIFINKFNKLYGEL